MKEMNSNALTKPTILPSLCSFLPYEKKFLYLWSGKSWVFLAGRYTHDIFLFSFPWPSYFGGQHGGKAGAFQVGAHEQIQILSQCRLEFENAIPGGFRRKASEGYSLKLGVLHILSLVRKRDVKGQRGMGRGRDADLIGGWLRRWT